MPTFIIIISSCAYNLRLSLEISSMSPSSSSSSVALFLFFMSELLLSESSAFAIIQISELKRNIWILITFLLDYKLRIFVFYYIMDRLCVLCTPTFLNIIDTGYAFVYFEDERDAEDAIRGIDNIPFGYEKRKLSVEWAKGERGKPHGKAASNQRPTKTLFVINFDPIRTKERDIERHFEPYGKVLNVRIRRNFAFVQFATQEDATKALESTQNSKLMDRVVSIEYALRDDDERDDRYAPSPRRRSPSPVYRRRPSPDYGRPRSPEYDRYKGPAPYERRRSPDYGRRSPEYGRARSPGYDRYRSRSPVYRARG